MIGPLKDLLSHQAWADARFFKAWEASGAQEDEDLRRRTDHLVATQEAFLMVLKGDEVVVPDRPLPGLAELRQRCQAAHLVFGALGRGLDAASLERPLRIPWFPEPPCIISASEALLQVCLHTQHHRGQNLTRLKALGAQAIPVDYIIWLWKQKPEAKWA